MRAKIHLVICPRLRNPARLSRRWQVFPSGLPARARAGDISQCQDLNHSKRTDEIAPLKSQKVETEVGISINESLSSQTLLNS